MKSTAFVLFLFSQTLTIKGTVNPLNPKTYKAAVLEHAIRPYVNSPLETMLANVKVYNDTAVKAAQMGADILAFPEYGIVGLEDLGEREMEFFIYLPDEAVGQWIPCNSPELFSDGNENYKVLEILSCAARDNSVVLLANLLTKEPCDATKYSTCPSVGFYKFNTNVIFSKNGTLLARYHKRHLFGEPELDPAPEPEFVIVDVGFVTFGTFTCQDIIYADPAVEYITKYGIRNLVFPTAWMSEFPFLSTPQTFSHLARGLGVNFIVSNPYYPSLSRLGSGIYSSVKGPLIENYDLAISGRLLIAELPVNPLPVPDTVFNCTPSTKNQSMPFHANASRFASVYESELPSSAPVNVTYKVWYQQLENFSRIFLDECSGNITLCEDDLCCHLEYSYQNPNRDLYVFAIHNGDHPLGFTKVHEQVCSLLRCETENIDTCGRVPQKSTSATFERLSITGSFATPIFFPSIIGTDLQSIPHSEWEFSKGECSENVTEFKYGGKIKLTSSASKPILVANIFGRVYERD